MFLHLYYKVYCITKCATTVSAHNYLLINY